MHPHNLAALLFLANWTLPAGAAEVFQTDPAISPDGRSQLQVRYSEDPAWPEARIDVVLKESGKELFRTRIPPEAEARYAKLAWAPDSRAALVAINYKSQEDLILIRLRHGRAISTRFDGDKLLVGRLLETLPWREEIKSSAPVSRVAWSTVRWPGTGFCSFLYIDRGLGYEGAARVVIRFHRNRPTLTIRSITAGVEPSLWDQD